jgi:type II secretory pathway pseudopilin PulG
MSRLFAARHRRDEGFTLIEATFAIVIAAIAFTALSAALLSTLKAALTSRLNQQSIDVASAEVESLRALDYAAVANSSTDTFSASEDPNLASCGASCWTYDPDGTGPKAPEKIYLVAGAGVPQHVQTVTVGNTKFTRRTYVTTVADSSVATAAYRRVTVVVTWSLHGVNHTHVTSTFVTATRRGLPLPRAVMDCNDATAAVHCAKTVTQGSTIGLGVVLTNRGARDAYTLTTPTVPAGWTFNWYVDVNQDGNYDPATDTTVVSGSPPTTPQVETDNVLYLLAVYTLSPTAPIGANTVKLQAQSVAQPTAATAVNTATYTITVTAPSCGASTCWDYWLHNALTAPTGNSNTSGADMPMNKGTPTSATLYDYDGDGLAGRLLTRDGSVTASWLYQVPGTKKSSATYSGTARVVLWMRNKDSDSGKAEKLDASLCFQNGGASGNSYVCPATAVASTPLATGYGGWTAVSLNIPVSAQTVPVSNNVRLIVQLDSSSAEDVEIGYDTTSYNAELVMPATAGG